MKKIIPFKKEIVFKTNLSEITSISLEHTLQVDKNNMVLGEFIVSGEYKMVDTSVNVEAFSFNIPFEVSIDEKYIIDKVIVDIYDFYYEIINNNVLALNIEVIVDRLREKPLIDEIIENGLEEVEKVKDEIELEEKEKEIEVIEEEEEIRKEAETNELEEREINENDVEITKSLFDNFDSRSETYMTYKVYIVREGDTLDVLIQNYGVTKEELEKYNNLNELNIGDRLIIPLNSDETD